MKKSVSVNKRKRTTFWKIFAKAAAVALAITALFSFAVSEFIALFIYEEMSTGINETVSVLQSHINQMQNYGRTPEIQADLCQYTHFETGVWQHWFPTVTTEDAGNAAVALIADNEGNRLLDNRNMFISLIKFDLKSSSANGRYFCDYDRLGITQLKEIYEKYNDLGRGKYAVYNVTSAVINEETREFVPVDLNVVTFETVKNTFEGRELASEDYRIDTNGFEGRYVEFTGIFNSAEKYPFAGVSGFWGADEEAQRRGYGYFGGDVNGNMAVYSESEAGTSDVLCEQQSRTIYIDGKEYYLRVAFIMQKWCPGTRLFWLLGTLCAFLGTMFIALLYSWRKNTINKAQYAFEDYQRALTNNLAHDIKTPLAAIAGYAENLREHCTGDKEQRYLSSILESVAFTDQLVCRTLDLNKRSSMKGITETEFSLRELVEECAEKYLPMLDEENKTFTVEGYRKIKTDREQYITAVENLLSNAVKYSRSEGSINVKIGEKRLTVTNDTAGKVDTKDLKMPFVKGDRSRTDHSSSGLGLAIAEQALTVCGSELEISSTDSSFTAEIIY